MYPFARNFGSGGMMDSPYDNLFGEEDEEQEVSPYGVPQAPQPPPETNFLDVYRELMNRQSGPAMQAYSKYLEAGFPKQEDYKPTKLNRLGAILSGAAAGYQNPSAGFDTARSILERPYERAVRRYGMEGGRLKEAAALEEGQYKNRVTATKDYIEAQNKEEDNKRQAKAAEILNQSRILGMEKTRAELKKLGLETHIDPTTGNLIGINILTGVKTDYGKIGAGEADRVREFGKRSNITLENQKRRTLFEAPLIDARQQRGFKHAEEQQARSFKQQDTAREDTQANQREMIAERARLRAKLPESATSKIRNNQFKVQSIVDSDPKRYEDLWSGEGLTDDIPEIGTPEYEDYKKLYNALYEGTSALGAVEPPKTVGKYKVVR